MSNGADMYVKITVGVCMGVYYCIAYDMFVLCADFYHAARAESSHAVMAETIMRALRSRIAVPHPTWRQSTLAAVCKHFQPWLPLPTLPAWLNPQPRQQQQQQQPSTDDPVSQLRALAVTVVRVDSDLRYSEHSIDSQVGHGHFPTMLPRLHCRMQLREMRVRQDEWEVEDVMPADALRARDAITGRPPREGVHEEAEDNRDEVRRRVALEQAYRLRKLRPVGRRKIRIGCTEKRPETPSFALPDECGHDPYICDNAWRWVTHLADGSYCGLGTHYVVAAIQQCLKFLRGHDKSSTDWVYVLETSEEVPVELEECDMVVGRIVETFGVSWTELKRKAMVGDYDKARVSRHSCKSLHERLITQLEVWDAEKGRTFMSYYPKLVHLMRYKIESKRMMMENEEKELEEDEQAEAEAGRGEVVTGRSRNNSSMPYGAGHVVAHSWLLRLILCLLYYCFRR